MIILYILFVIVLLVTIDDYCKYKESEGVIKQNYQENLGYSIITLSGLFILLIVFLILKY